MGAGPGPTKTYKVDAPFPWGKDTELVIPVQAMIDDAWAAALPHLDTLETKLIGDAEDEVSYYGPVATKKILDTVVTPYIDTELQTMLAQVDLLKNDAIKAGLALTGTVVIAISVAAWWIRKHG